MIKKIKYQMNQLISKLSKREYFEIDNFEVDNFDADINALKTVLRLIPMGQISSNIALFFLVILNRVEKIRLSLLLAYIFSTFISILWVIYAKKDVKQTDHSKINPNLHLIISLLSSISMGLIIYLDFMYVSNLDRIFIVGLGIVLITSGTFQSSMYFKVQIAWVIPLTFFLMICSFYVPDIVYKIWSLGLLFLSTIISYFAHFFSKTYKERFLLQRAAEENASIISILLGEYEENSSDWIWEIDLHLNVKRIGKRFLNLTQCELQNILNKPFDQVFIDNFKLDEANIQKMNLMNASLLQNNFSENVLISVTLEAETYWFNLNLQPHYNENGVQLGWTGVANDLTNLKIYEDQLIWQSRHDLESGLLNRSAFIASVNDFLITRSYSQCYEMLLFEVQNYRVLKSLRGQENLEKIILELSDRLQNLFKENALISRTESNQFAIFINCSKMKVDEIFKALVMKLNAPFLINDEIFKIECIFSAANSQQEDIDADHLLKNAELALLDRSNKQNTLIKFENMMREAYFNRVQLIHLLDKALENDEFYLVYQPKIDSKSRQIIGAEALIRWNQPSLGQIPPDVFIPLAEESSKIIEIGKYVLKKACDDIKQWPEHWKVSINISGIQIKEPDFTETIKSSLKEANIEGSRIILEVTESAFIDNVDTVETKLHQVKELGIRLSLDDFGTGFSSLSYIYKLPFDEVKIDKSFVSNINSINSSNGIIAVILQMTKTLGFVSVAEGVEINEHIDFLRHLDCDIYQGYFFSKPLEQEKLLEVKDVIFSC